MKKTPMAPKHVAQRLELSVSRIIQLDRQGVLIAMRDSLGRRTFDPDAVERYAAARERERKPAA